MGRPPLDLSLYLVTDTTMCGEFGVTATVSAAVAAGVTVVQLRDPLAGDDELVALGRSLREALAGTGVPLVLNDRVHLVEAVGADGAHVGQTDLSVLDARAQLGDAAYLGLSVQTLDHVRAAASLPPGTVDYLGAGPVWAQRTKPDAWAPSGPERLGELVRASPVPVVAIGGVTAELLPAVRSAGAAGAAVVSAICGRPDGPAVAAATRRLRQAWDGAA